MYATVMAGKLDLPGNQLENAAQMFAAANDLLAACADARPWLVNLNALMGNRPSIVAAIDAIDAAIAKATGENHG